MKDIPMHEIPEIPRKLAVAYSDVYMDFRDTVKMASDIQNYALSLVADRDKRIKELETAVKNISSVIPLINIPSIMPLIEVIDTTIKNVLNNK